MWISRKRYNQLNAELRGWQREWEKLANPLFQIEYDRDEWGLRAKDYGIVSRTWVGSQVRGHGAGTGGSGVVLAADAWPQDTTLTLRPPGIQDDWRYPPAPVCK